MSTKKSASIIFQEHRMYCGNGTFDPLHACSVCAIRTLTTKVIYRNGNPVAKKMSTCNDSRCRRIAELMLLGKRAEADALRSIQQYQISRNKEEQVAAEAKRKRWKQRQIAAGRTAHEPVHCKVFEPPQQKRFKSRRTRRALRIEQNCRHQKKLKSDRWQRRAQIREHQDLSEPLVVMTVQPHLNGHRNGNGHCAVPVELTVKKRLEGYV